MKNAQMGFLLLIAGILFASCFTTPEVKAGRAAAPIEQSEPTRLPECKASSLLEPRTCRVVSASFLHCSGEAGAGEISLPDGVAECRWESPWDSDVWVQFSQSGDKWSPKVGGSIAKAQMDAGTGFVDFGSICVVQAAGVYMTQTLPGYSCDPFQHFLSKEDGTYRY